MAIHIPVFMPAAIRRAALVTLAAWGGALAPLQAQQVNTASVAALVQEAVGKIFDHALQTTSKPGIYQKAWLALLLEEGRTELAAKHDFSILSTEESEQQFINALNDLAKEPGQRRTLRELAESALQNYCRQHDAYTRYTRSEEYKHIKLMAKGEGSHIGMSINEKDRSFYCYPMPDGPAEKAGLKAGDRLLAVDGRSVEGRPLEYVTSLIKGAPDTPVELRVEHGFGRTESIAVVRASLDVPELLIEKKVGGLVLRVRRFNNDLLDDTRKALASLQPGQNLTIDLRGCTGGILDSALQFAALFLQPGEPIVGIRMRDRPDEQYAAEKPAEFQPNAIILLQDEGTASAAEMVIAALLNSKSLRVTSQGAKTYGKGVMLSRFELKGGGALTVTSGELIAPQGRSWDGTGLLSSLEHGGKIFPETEAP